MIVSKKVPRMVQLRCTACMTRCTEAMFLQLIDLQCNCGAQCKRSAELLRNESD